MLLFHYAKKKVILSRSSQGQIKQGTKENGEKLLTILITQLSLAGLIDKNYSTSEVDRSKNDGVFRNVFVSKWL